MTVPTPVAPTSPLSGAVVAAAPGALAPVEPRHDPEVTP